MREQFRIVDPTWDFNQHTELAARVTQEGGARAAVAEQTHRGHEDDLHVGGCGQGQALPFQGG
jgi:hypothetical protein